MFYNEHKTEDQDLSCVQGYMVTRNITLFFKLFKWPVWSIFKDTDCVKAKYQLSPGHADVIEAGLILFLHHLGNLSV